MSKIIRQENLYGAEDWSVVYNSFKHAEFKSYDFDTLRTAMMSYMQTNYAEEFNDYIQNSEFIALLDLVAYVGQNLAFRMDLNARENILDTAEKRESVLRIARMLSYKPKRVRPAQGLLKIVSVITTAQVLDSTGNNLANQIVTWGSDPSEVGYERFVKILDAALNNLNPIGTPVQRYVDSDSGTSYETYDFDNSDKLTNVPLAVSADGMNLTFEMVPVKLEDDGAITQKEPDYNSAFSMLYRNDGRGVGSTRTGFFLFAKQGYTVTETRNIPSPQVNMSIDLTNTANISEEDFTVQSVDAEGNILTTWKRTDTLDYTNLVTNNFGKEKNVYEVLYSDADITSLKFGDGSFTNAPSGLLRLWYRISQNDYVRVKAGDISNAKMEIKYKDENGNTQSLYLVLELQDNMITGLPAETTDEIKTNAPEAFYSKNRMVTGDDYNGFLTTLNNDIMLMRAENRTFSGHSRNVDLKDPTGKSRPLVEFADDGYLYRQESNKTVYVADNSGIRNIDFLNNNIESQLSDVGLLNFYYGKLNIAGELSTTEYPTIKLGETQYYTTLSTNINAGDNINTVLANNINTADPYDSFAIDGGMIKIDDELFTYSSITNNQFNGLTRAAQGTVVQNHQAGAAITRMNDIRWRVAYYDLTSSNGYFTDSNSGNVPQQLGYSSGDILRNVRPGAMVKLEDIDGSYVWASVIDIKGDGLGVENSQGDYTGLLVTGDGPVELSRSVTGNRLLTEILPAFPRVFDDGVRTLMMNKLDTRQSFALSFDNTVPAWTLVDTDTIDETADFDSDSLDTSWVVIVKRETSGWSIITRQLEYIFGSRELIRFYNINFLPAFNTNYKNISKDDISVIATDANNKLVTKQKYRITGYYVYDDGYTDNSKVKVSPLDLDGDFLPDEPEGFSNVVENNTLDLISYEEGEFSYIVPAESGNTDTVLKTVSGKDGLIFKWNHVVSQEQTANPSLTNIIDVYVLTKSYNNDFVAWKRKNNKFLDIPLPPTTEEIRSSFRNLSSYKMMTDELIFHPVKFKPLFGALSAPEFQAQFKIIKNAKSRSTDNEVKSKVLSAIDAFFEPGNFDFGETFYFTELAAFIHSRLPTEVNSVVLVPISTDGRFGTLFQIQPDRDEMITSVATVNDIIVINEITDSNIRIGR
jgi:hypothetical protein